MWQRVTEYAGICLMIRSTVRYITRNLMTYTGQPNGLVLLLNRVRELPVRISAGTPEILPDIFHGFPKSLQKHAGILPRLGHDRFLLNPFQILNHLLPYHSTLHILFIIIQWRSSPCRA
jgi:hypothetical protein